MSEDLEDNELWRDKLTPEEFRIAREKGTERAFSGEYWDTKEMGAYNCKCCGESLFRARRLSGSTLTACANKVALSRQ